jgi:hypothetical protein
MIPLCSINLLSSFNKSFCFRKSIFVGACVLVAVGFLGCSVVVSSIEKEKFNSVLSLNKWISIS